MVCWKALVLFFCGLHYVQSIPQPSEQPLQAVVDNMAQKLTALEAKINAQQAEIDSNKLTVAFHAFGSTSSVKALDRGTIVVPLTFMNIGKAYDSRTGLFTAPVSGLYQFHASFMDHDNANGVGVGIYVGDTEVAEGGTSHNTDHFDIRVVVATAHVTQGQAVQLRNQNYGVAYLDGQSLAFSGFLIRAD